MKSAIEYIRSIWFNRKEYLMSIVYKLWDAVEEYLLRKFLFEVTFTIKTKGNNQPSKCSLSLIIMVRTQDEAYNVALQIANQLSKFNWTVSPYTLEPVDLPENRQQRERLIIDQIQKSTIQYLSFETWYPKLLDVPTEDLKYMIKKNRFPFRYVKNNLDLLFQNDQYLVTINAPQE